MARILIIGCGCRGRILARELGTAGHVVRGTTRDPSRKPEIEATGAQAYVGDPNRVGSLIAALDGVTIMCILLGSATGSPDHLKTLHTNRLEMLLQRTIDTTIHGITYEATGAINQTTLTTGAELVQQKCNLNGIPHKILHPTSNNWLETSTGAIEALLAGK